MGMERSMIANFRRGPRHIDTQGWKFSNQERLVSELRNLPNHAMV